MDFKMLPVIVGIEGPVLTARERELFTRLQPAGYILFSRNITDYELVRELTDELRALTSGPDEPQRPSRRCFLRTFYTMPDENSIRSL